MNDPRRTGIAGLVSIAFYVALGIGCAPAPPPDNSSEARAGIAAVNGTFMQLVEAKNAAGLAALYTDTARIMPPNGAPIEGHAAIEQFFAAILQGVAKVQLDTVEVEGHGDTAHEVEALAFFDANGAKIDEGKAIVIWKKVGNEWKLHRDMFSSNLPPPPPAAPAADSGMPADSGGGAENAPAKTP